MEFIKRQLFLDLSLCVTEFKLVSITLSNTLSCMTVGIISENHFVVQDMFGVIVIFGMTTNF